MIENGWLFKSDGEQSSIKLKHLVHSRAGFAFPSESYVDDGISLVRIGDLSQNGEIDMQKSVSLPSKFSKYLEGYSVAGGDILMAMTGGTIGKVSIYGLPEVALLNQRVCKFTAKNKVRVGFLWYWMNSSYWKKYIELNSEGGAQPNISDLIVKEMYIPLPSEKEQTAIANFLDKKTVLIDEAIAIKEQQIALLKERQQIIIQQAVTRGLDPNVPMKDSGVDWIGEIPAHWEVKRAKYLFDEVDERSETGAEELLSVSHMTGVTPRSEKKVSMFLAEDYTGSKLCKKGDLVFNIMWAWMGALGVSGHEGIVSPSYGIFRQQKTKNFDSTYLEYLLKSTRYVEYYNKVSTGLHSSRLRFYGHMFFNMAMGFPSFDEQKLIVETVSIQSRAIDEALAIQYQQIQKLKEYKTTLINSAVTGKIKVS